MPARSKASLATRPAVKIPVNLSFSGQEERSLRPHHILRFSAQCHQPCRGAGARRIQGRDAVCEERYLHCSAPHREVEDSTDCPASSTHLDLGGTSAGQPLAYRCIQWRSMGSAWAPDEQRTKRGIDPIGPRDPTVVAHSSSAGPRRHDPAP